MSTLGRICALVAIGGAAVTAAVVLRAAGECSRAWEEEALPGSYERIDEDVVVNAATGDAMMSRSS